MISINKNTVFYEEFPLLRGLSHKEIENASVDMSVDFVSKGILPLFDVGDNDYIAFNFVKNKWCKYNIADESEFSNVSSIFEYIL
jgi:hypothetical protein